MVKILDIEEITNIYNKYILNDFPASEVKSLRRILEGVQNGQYYACAYMEEDEIKAYAFFIQSPFPYKLTILSINNIIQGIKTI